MRWATDSVTDSRTGTDGRRANGSRFGLGGLVPGWVLGFGGRVCGVVNGLCHGLTDGNGWTTRKWESLRSGWACPCGGLWVSAGVSVGERKDEG